MNWSPSVNHQSQVAPQEIEDTPYSHTEQTTPRVKVIKTMALFGIGGTEGQALNLVKGLERPKYEVQFACLRKWGHLLDEIERLQIPVTEFRIRSLYKPHGLHQMLKFAAYLQGQGAHIMHSYNFYANVFAVPAARLAGVPVVIASIRDQGIYLSPAQRVVQKWVCRLADRVLVNADSIRNWLSDEGYAPSKITVIKNGIDISRFQKCARNHGVRESLGIPLEVPVVVMLARLHPLKGVDDFIKAAAKVAKEHPGTRFLLVGQRFYERSGELEDDGQYYRRVQRLADELGIGQNVIATGYRSDIPELLATASVSVLPSLSEGISNSILESMAAGVPVVTTRVGGSPELVQDQVTGYLVPPGAPDIIAERISRILANPGLARKLGEQARTRATDYFSLEKMVKDTQAVYESELSNKVRPLQLR